MTSSQVSPVSAVSDTSRLYERHLPAKLSAAQSKSLQLSERTAAAPKYAFLSLRTGATTSGHMSENIQLGNYYHSSHPAKVGAAYDSFRRDHETHGTSQRTEAPVVGPSLAPPADIVARSTHSDVSKNQPPPLCTNDIGTNSAPVTPPPKRQPKTRTQSQQAEVEKDAVETLLFMSSPGNSGHHPPGVFARTALRNQVTHQVDQIDSLGFARSDEARSLDEQHGLSYSQFLQSPTRKRLLSNAEMDKILDEMTSSSDDGELQDQHLPPQVLKT